MDGPTARPPALRLGISWAVTAPQLTMTSDSRGVRQALKTLQTLIRQRPGADEAVVDALRDSRSGTEVRLTGKQVAAMKTAEEAIASDEHFEYLAPAENEVQVFAADSAADRQTDHVKPFMDRYRKEVSERICHFGVEVLRVTEPAEICGVRLLPLTDTEIPSDNPLFRLDSPVGCVAAVAVTGTGDVPMAARARRHAQHALRVLRDRLALRRTGGCTRCSCGPGRHLARVRGGAGGWDMHDDVA